MDALTLKRHDSFKIFALRPLTFKLQQEVLKLNGICVS